METGFSKHALDAVRHGISDRLTCFDSMQIGVLHAACSHNTCLDVLSSFQAAVATTAVASIKNQCRRPLPVCLDWRCRTPGQRLSGRDRCRPSLEILRAVDDDPGNRPA